jgi:hypothetical protein
VRARAQEALRYAIRWLNPPAPEVVRIRRTASPSSSGDADVGGPTIRRQVARWRGRVRRARGAVVLRRYLALALGLAVLGEVIARLASSETHPLWAFAGVAVALAGASAALLMPITDATVAEMLDRGLGLFDRIGTGLELEARTKGSPMLAAQVVAEAQRALRSSFGTARARPRPAGREWGVLLVLALVLALIVALPKIGHAQSVRPPLAHHGAGSTVGKVQHRGSASRRLHRRHHASLPVGAGVDNNFSQPPLAISPSSQETGKGLGSSIYGHGGRSTGNYQIAKTGLSETAGTRLIAAPGSGTGKPGSNGASGAGPHSAGSAGAKPSGGASTGGRLSAPGASSGNSPNGAHAGGRGPGAPAAHGGQAANGGSQSGQSRPQAAPPGGENAGASRGSSRLGPALAPDLASGHAGLPLQAGFAPSAARNAGHGGISQTPNGGGGRARSQNAGGAVGGGSGQSGATPIQPTPNTGAASTQSLVSSYFGGANQLRPGSW